MQVRRVEFRGCGELWWCRYGIGLGGVGMKRASGRGKGDGELDLILGGRAEGKKLSFDEMLVSFYLGSCRFGLRLV